MDLKDVHEQLEAAGTATLVKHHWHKVEDNFDKSSPLSYSSSELSVAKTLSIDKFAAFMHQSLLSAAHHGHVTCVASLLTLPRLRRSGVIEQLKNEWDRFLTKAPTSEDDETLMKTILFMLTERLSDGKLEDEYSDRKMKLVRNPWLKELTATQSFLELICQVLHHELNGFSPSSSVLLLRLLTLSPSPAAAIVVINWLGSGLELENSELVPVLAAAFNCVTRTVVQFGTFEKEPLRRFCVHAGNVLRHFLLDDPKRINIIQLSACALRTAMFFLKTQFTECEMGGFCRKLFLEGEIIWLPKLSYPLLHRLSWPFISYVLSNPFNASSLIHRWTELPGLILEASQWAEALRCTILLTLLLGDNRFDKNVVTYMTEEESELVGIEAWGTMLVKNDVVGRFLNNCRVIRKCCDEDDLALFDLRSRLLILSLKGKVISLSLNEAKQTRIRILESFEAQLPNISEEIKVKFYRHLLCFLDLLLDRSIVDSTSQPDEKCDFLRMLTVSGFFRHAFLLFQSPFGTLVPSLTSFICKVLSQASSMKRFLYSFSVDLLKCRHVMTDFFLTKTNGLCTSSLLALIDFWNVILVRLGHETECLEALDGLFDIPDEIGDAPGSKMATILWSWHTPELKRHPKMAEPLREKSGALLSTLIAVSASAKSTVLELGLVDSLIDHANDLHDALVVDSLNGAHDADGSIPARDPVLSHLIADTQMLQNVLTESPEAKSLAAARDVGVLLRRLWRWAMINDALMAAVLGLLGAFAADNPVGVAKCIVNSRSVWTDRLSSSSSRHSPIPSSASLVHAVILYVSKLKLTQTPNCHQRRCFVILGQMSAVSPEVRGILTKTQFLCGFAELNVKKATSAFLLHSAWLDLVCTLTVNGDGQGMAMKTKGFVDTLIDYLCLEEERRSSEGTPRDDRGIVQLKTTPTASIRQKAALATHNLCFSTNPASLLSCSRALPRLVTLATRWPTREADQKTALIACAALWALLRGSQKNAVAVKSTGCQKRVQEALYRMKRQPVEDDSDDARYIQYLGKLSVILMQ